MKRKELIAKIRKVAHSYGCNGNETSDQISNAFGALADELEPEISKVPRTVKPLTERTAT